jgi:hypothetical protein
MIWCALASGPSPLVFNRISGFERLLIGIIYPGKTLDLSTPCLGVHTVGIALFANFERSVHEDFNKVIFADHGATFVARRPVRTYRCANYRTMMADNLGGHKADPKNVRIPIFLVSTRGILGLKRATVIRLCSQTRSAGAAAFCAHDRDDGASVRPGLDMIGYQRWRRISSHETPRLSGRLGPGAPLPATGR